MKRIPVLLLSLMLVGLTGCDFLRSVAGRPTSKDIEKKRLEIIKAEEEALQNRLDSIKLAKEKMVQDSLDTFAALEEEKVLMSGISGLGGLAAGTELDSRYYLVVGAFRESQNAGNLFSEATAKGYSPVLISCKNGRVLVALSPSDRIVDIAKTYKAAQQETFCPKEAWILINE